MNYGIINLNKLKEIESKITDSELSYNMLSEMIKFVMKLTIIEAKLTLAYQTLLDLGIIQSDESKITKDTQLLKS